MVIDKSTIITEGSVREFSSEERQRSKERQSANTRSYNVGSSDYSDRKIQPWDIWLEYGLNPWDADIIKRVLRHKPNERTLDYEKIIHICQERIRQIDEGYD